MKNSLWLIGIFIAVLVLLGFIFSFVHPIVVLTIKDIFGFICFDVALAFCLALYIGWENKNKFILWFILGILFLPASIIAAILKYNKK